MGVSDGAVTTRREFVTMLLGGAAACSVSGTRTPPGTLIETGMRRGHQMRDAAPVVPSASTGA